MIIGTYKETEDASKVTLDAEKRPDVRVILWNDLEDRCK